MRRAGEDHLSTAGKKKQQKTKPKMTGESFLLQKRQENENKISIPPLVIAVESLNSGKGQGIV